MSKRVTYPSPDFNGPELIHGALETFNCRCVPASLKKHIRNPIHGINCTVVFKQLSGTTGELPDLAIIKPIADEFRINDNVLALIPFGSVAHGHACSDSDIGLCVITKKG